MSLAKLPIEDYLVIAYLLKKAGLDGIVLTPLQINKLVYICHGWVLAKLNCPLIDNSSGQIQAWKYGPVVHRVYVLLKDFGSQEVTYDSFCERLERFLVGEESADNYISGKLEYLASKEPSVFKLIDMVWYVYKGLSGGQLITITHKHGTPWYQKVKRNVFGQVLHAIPIPDQIISDYYKNELRELPDFANAQC